MQTHPKLKTNITSLTSHCRRHWIPGCWPARHHRLRLCWWTEGAALGDVAAWTRTFERQSPCLGSWNVKRWLRCGDARPTGPLPPAPPATSQGGCARKTGVKLGSKNIWNNSTQQSPLRSHRSFS
jgi:hypothetical protein